MPHGDHEMNWVHAIKGTDQISVPFDYAAKLTEIMLLGIVSLRANSKLLLRRHEHARHQQRGRERLPDAGVPGGVFVVGGRVRILRRGRRQRVQHEGTKRTETERRPSCHVASRLLAPRDQSSLDASAGSACSSPQRDRLVRTPLHFGPSCRARAFAPPVAVARVSDVSDMLRRDTQPAGPRLVPMASTPVPFEGKSMSSSIVALFVSVDCAISLLGDINATLTCAGHLPARVDAVADRARAGQDARDPGRRHQGRWRCDAQGDVLSGGASGPGHSDAPRLQQGPTLVDAAGDRRGGARGFTSSRSTSAGSARAAGRASPTVRSSSRRSTSTGRATSMPRWRG